MLAYCKLCRNVNRKAVKNMVSQSWVFSGPWIEGTMNEYSDRDIIEALQKQNFFNMIGICLDLENYSQVKTDAVSDRPQMDSFLKKRADKEEIYV